MEKRLLIGAHTSGAGGLENALIEGESIGATTIQIFTANQRRWESQLLTQDKIAIWQRTVEETKMQSIMSHGSYLINLGAPDEEVLRKSRKAFREEIQRCLQFNIPLLNFHPGAAVSSSLEDCLNRIVESLLLVEDLTNKGSITLILETTAGQGSTIGRQFEELHYIIEKVKNVIPIGVCIDTCHIFAAGYDIRTKEGWDKTLQAFDTIIGLEYLKAFHLNDSLGALGSHKDRHRPLGLGEIGLASFQALMQNPKIKTIPKYLETPDGPSLWKQEIKMLLEF